MTAEPEPSGYLLKALLSLEGAESEYATGRFDNCASRCYYAAFQAAIHALQQAGIRPQGSFWGHAFVHSQFDGQLIFRRHLYDASLRHVLRENLQLRRKADYDERAVSQRETLRALQRTRAFVSAIAARDVQ